MHKYIYIYNNNNKEKNEFDINKKKMNYKYPNKFNMFYNNQNIDINNSKTYKNFIVKISFKI